MKTHSVTTARKDFKRMLDECQDEPVYLTKLDELYSSFLKENR